MSWAVVIATAGFIQTVGKFLDDHHVPTEFRERVRLWLIAIFVLLEQTSVPSLTNRMFAKLLRSGGRITLTYYSFISMLAFSPIFIAMNVRMIIYTNYYSYGLFHPSILSGIEITSLIWGDIAVVSCLASATLLFPMRWIFRVFHNSDYLALKFVSIPVLLIIYVLVVGAAYKLMNSVNGLNLAGYLNHAFTVVGLPAETSATIAIFLIFFGFVTKVAMLVTLIPFPIAILFSIVLLALKIGLIVIRRLLLFFLNTSTHPKNSPFTYTFGLIGIALLLVKSFS